MQQNYIDRESCEHSNKRLVDSQVGSDAFYCSDCNTIVIEVTPHKHEWLMPEQFDVDQETGEVRQWWACKHCPKMVGCRPGLDPNMENL